MISRRTVLGTGAVAAATLAAPSILHAQTKTLKITTWGGKWGEIMKATVLPAFEKEFKCTVSADQAFPYAPKLQASPTRVFFEVTLPLIRPGVFAGGVFAFIVSFDQFPVSLFLVVPKGETLPVVLFNYMKFDLDGAIAAASMVSILLALSVVLVLERLIGLKAYVKL